MFRNYANNRCLIFVEGFFEWKHVGKEKVPHFIYMPGHEPFALGGIHTTWHSPNSGHEISGCSIITTDADELMATIHNSKKRMPLVLSEDKWSKWLDPYSTRWDIQELMKPYDEGKLIAHEISKLITSRMQDNDVPDVQEHLPPSTLF